MIGVGAYTDDYAYIYDAEGRAQPDDPHVRGWRASWCQSLQCGLNWALDPSG
ncbi:MAG: hypothetical protein R2856_03315 [Caldilineaceae bacterium]